MEFGQFEVIVEPLHVACELRVKIVWRKKTAQICFQPTRSHLNSEGLAAMDLQN